MPEPRAFKDRPFRRVGVAALIAIAIHGVVLGAGAYLFGDYVFSDPRKPRLTNHRLERAIAETPILLPGLTMSEGPAADADEPDIRTADWSDTRMSTPSWSWWSWEADPKLSATLVVPEPRK